MPDPVFQDLGITQGVPLLEDTALRVRLTHTGTQVNFTVRARIQLMSGIIIEKEELIVLTTSPQAVTSIFDLTEGWLLSVVVGNISNTFAPGETYVSLHLQKGTATGTLPYQTLARGYLHGVAGFSWPPSQFEAPGDVLGAPNALTTANPGAGNNLSVEIPAAHVVLVLGCGFTFTADANAATRRFIINASNHFMNYKLDTTVTAGNSLIVSLWQYGFDDYVEDDTYHGSWPQGIYMKEADEFTITVDNIQAGDTLTTISVPILKWATED